MSAYQIPRNVKGEGRIFFIFTPKSLIYTCVTGVVGLVFYYLFGKLLGLTIVGIFIALIFAFIGFAVGTFKIPETDTFEITRKAGGLPIDEAIVKWFKFKKDGKKIYTYFEKTKEEE